MEADADFELIIRGVRGGFPKPGPNTLKYGGNTTCFEIHAGGHHLLIDAGTGIIAAGDDLLQTQRAAGRPLHCSLLFTHLHHDHIQGLPFFVPLQDPNFYLHVFGPQFTAQSTFENDLLQVVLPPYSPLGIEKLLCQYKIQPIASGEMLVFTEPDQPPQKVTTLPAQLPPQAVWVRTWFDSHHPRNGVLIYRIEYDGKSLVIATDTEGQPDGNQDLIRFVNGADLLLHDAEYNTAEYASSEPHRRGWGHSTWQMAVEVARQAGVRQLQLIHHHHAHNDRDLDEMEAQAQQIFPAAQVAREGARIVI